MNISEITVLSIIDMLIKNGKLEIDRSPLKNGIEPDNNIYYTAIDGYSKAFKEISTPNSLIEYLSDSKERLKDSGYIYHYTILPVLIKMLKGETWHLANAKNMNDRLEFDNGDIEKWDNILFSSFMTEDKESIGMCHKYNPT